ncbi:MAG: thioredoxin domain-containing protein [Sandaracinaceae bacterium]|nr:thioredoxin domain-containing protein [Sandaracinaceae bacterium]
MALSAGDRVAGKYRVERLLGEGGMGAVYVAENERLRKRVALKVLADATVAPDAVDRFVREAIAASSVKHPGIVEIYDADVHEGTPWIAMELLEGETLGARIERGGPLSVDEALDVALEALAALGAVHAAGIIHRDLKPDNLFLEQLPGNRRRVKVLDFGIAKIVDHEVGSTTKTGIAMGTPYFLAPEQATNAKSIDARADVYAIGGILFHALSGQLPYVGGTFGELVRQMYTSGPRRLTDVAPQVPPRRGGGRAALPERRPAARPASAEELAAELSRARSAPAASPGVAKTMAIAAAPPGSIWGPSAAQTGEPAGSVWGAPSAPNTAEPAGSVWGAPSAPQTAEPVGAVWGAPSTPAAGSAWGPPSGPGGASGQVWGPGAGSAPAGDAWRSAAQHGVPPNAPPPFTGGRPSSGGAAALLIGGLAIAGVVLLGVVGIVAYGLTRDDETDTEIAEETAPPSPLVGAASVSSLGLPGATAERLRAEAPASAPQRGPADALVTIVMWSDYQCPFCGRVEPTLARLRQTFGNDLRIVWRDNALPFHQNAMPAAELAREAYAQGGSERYWQMHDILFENQQALSRSDLESYAPRIGLDLARVRAALDAHTHRAGVQADMEAASALGARGTPAFFINGRQLMGAQPYERFEEVVNEELALARAAPRARRAARAGLRDLPGGRAHLALAGGRSALALAERAPAAGPCRGLPRAGRRLAGPGPERRARHHRRLHRVPVPLLQPRAADARSDPRALRERRAHRLQHNPLPFHQNAMPAAEAAVEVSRRRARRRSGATTIASSRTSRASRARTSSSGRGSSAASTWRASAARSTRTRTRRASSRTRRWPPRSGATGTPSFFINGRNLRGAQPFDAFQRVIDEELARARAAVAAGTPRAQVYEAVTRDGHTTRRSCRALLAGAER